ncbi:precorrin-6y C5,15-methyltransferase (decarboxylating) subunit CbiE, partial [Streptomyces sp. NPDC057545]
MSGVHGTGTGARTAAPIRVFGTGTGEPLGPEAREALEAATLVIGARRHLEAAYPGTGAREAGHAGRIVLGPLAPALDRVAEHLARDEARVVVLASGDPGFFGIVRALAERFGADALDVRPGAPSVAVAFARLGLTWDDAVVVSAHGRDPRTAVHACLAHP